MTDPINPAAVAPPVEFDPTATRAVIGTVAAAVLIVLSSCTTLLGLLKARDVIAILRWIQGAEGLAFAGAVTLLGTVGARVWLTIRKHARSLIAVRSADNAVARVKGE